MVGWGAQCTPLWVPIMFSRERGEGIEGGGMCLIYCMYSAA